MNLIKISILIGFLLIAGTDSSSLQNKKGDGFHSGKSRGDHQENYANFLKIYSDLATSMLEKPDAFEETPVKRVDEPIDDDLTKVPFTCERKGPQNPVPTSVHKLTPGDIGVVAALGDSITAGNGIRATSALRVAFINRGESFSVGGDRSLEEGVVTLPNILKKFNPDLAGESYCSRTKLHTQAGFNVALPGATNLNLKSQAEELVTKLAQNLTIFYDQWKVITLLIGGNDLCQHCIRDGMSPTQYSDGIKAALDVMRDHIPRAFVNLVIMADVSVVPELIHEDTNESIALCHTLHAIECPCANENTTDELRNLQLEYYRVVDEMVETGDYESREDFTVVVQPFLKDQKPLMTADGKWDMRYFAPDCFHPSYKSHQFFAYQLWNSMLIKYGAKPTKVDETVPLQYLCPSESYPYFFTKRNSPPN